MPAASLSAAAPAAGAPAAAAAGGVPSEPPLLHVTATEVVQRTRAGGSEAYSFSGVFQGSGQEELFNTAIAPLVSSAMSCMCAAARALPACLPAYLPACLRAGSEHHWASECGMPAHACPLARLPACLFLLLPANQRTKRKDGLIIDTLV